MLRYATAILLLFTARGWSQTPATGFQVWVSNERSGNVTVIDGDTHKVVATIAVGKRPRGIHPSPDGKLMYVAVSGSPIGEPTAKACRFSTRMTTTKRPTEGPMGLW
jgi:YVTN family beta-propeller protein